ncbi:MAG TPA: VWA domain-containing protein [Roseiflexaceae bacterium]|nr:VWA domain-containing protein [Roseiflexaceae bacterium]
MSFLFPLGLLALLSIPIILVLHLVREQRKRQVVPSLMLWKNIPRRHDGTRRRLLPLTLLLLFHLLAAALLGLAIGRPQITGLPGNNARHLAILLDTSTSMGAREGSSTRFDMARGEVRSLLAGMQPGDRATLIAVGAVPTVLGEGGAGDAAILRAAVDRLQPGGTGFDLERALQLADAALDPRLSRRIIAFSDGAFQTTTTQTVGVPFEWRQVGSYQDNRAIVTFAARPWAGKTQVFARVANYGNTPFTGSLQLFADETPVSTDVVTLAPDGERELTWSLPTGAQRLRAGLNGLDGLPADDQAYLNLAVVRPIKAVLVSTNPEPIQRALRAIPAVSVETVAPDAYTPDATADLTIFDAFLPQAWPNGAILAISPPAGNALLEVGTETRSLSGERLIQRGELLDGLSFGGVSFGQVQRISAPEWAVTQLAARSDDQNGAETPLILRGRDGNHEMAVWSFSVSGSNLPARLAFPLLMARTLRDLTATPPPMSVGAGQRVSMRPDPRATSVAIVAPDGASTELPAAAASDLELFTQPGFYTIEEKTDGVNTYTGALGVNAGATGESDLRPLSVPVVEAPPNDSGSTTVQRSFDLWPWLAAILLALLAFEWMYVLRRRYAA